MRYKVIFRYKANRKKNIYTTTEQKMKIFMAHKFFISVSFANRFCLFNLFAIFLIFLQVFQYKIVNIEDNRINRYLLVTDIVLYRVLSTNQELG